ncbi:hypothetical protein O181_097599 [Austropuccinia psidii MF-1]|uniref:Uncharacterized protein n=1 Tax=Austropuccinia psidii MF-1 TaxID=1389203 RepID=A0A9Q3PDR6_9BASI|nr:hypothetical protein [Austropuccinia psidii MF-1]
MPFNFWIGHQIIYASEFPFHFALSPQCIENTQSMFQLNPNVYLKDYLFILAYALLNVIIALPKHFEFTAFNYVDPDDPLTKPDPDCIINQQNQQISILQQQLEQSQNAYQAILEKVNFLQIQNTSKEKNKKNRKETTTIPEQRNNPKIRDICYKFGVANSFPKRYLKILVSTDSHRNDEYISKSNYKINKLLFRSENANKFMRRVDEEIEKAERIKQKRSWGRNRIVVDSPSISIHSHPPKGLPIDFYNPSWFNNCPPGQKTTVADAFNVAFLPDASQSIRGIQHPDERLNDQNFTEKYWEKCAEAYDLSHEIAREDKDSESDDSAIIDDNSESDDDTGEEGLEPDKNEGQVFDQLSNQDTEMAHAQDLDQFMVGGSGIPFGAEWQ